MDWSHLLRYLPSEHVIEGKMESRMLMKGKTREKM